MDVDNTSRSNIGKLRSNFLGTKFIIYDTKYNSSCQMLSSPPNPSSGCFNYSKKVSPKVTSGGSYNIGEVNYELNLLRTRGPRQIHCIMNSNPSLPLEPKVVGPREEEAKERPLVLRNEQPRWLEHLQCWCLNFKGRVTVASVKNFQLMRVHSSGGTSDDDRTILQFGKVDKDVFTMDYSFPLSAFQAFAICLTSFDTKIGTV